MKINRKVGLVVIVIIIAVALGSLFSVYSGQAREKEDLHDRLSTAETLLPGLVKQKQDLEDQLATAQSALNASLSQFPDAVRSIEYDDDLFEIADKCNVAISRLTASPPGDRKVGDLTYSVSSYTVAITGDVDNMLKFIDALRTGEDFELPWSAEVKTINMDVAGSAATISLDIYGYKR
jgi:hypothetical protein